MMKAERRDARPIITCGFVVCGAEFRKRHKQHQFCSNECQQSHKILQWAPTLTRLKEEGKNYKEIGIEMNISRDAALLRAIRLNQHCQDRPKLVMALENPNMHPVYLLPEGVPSVRKKAPVAKSEAGTRNCLRCRQAFYSTGTGNRMCRNCRSRDL